MTRDEFQAASIALLRSAIGWQTAIARRLGVESRTVRRWLRSGEIPAWVDARLAELMGGIGPSPWPRDEWVIGDGVTGDGRAREYIIHVAAPRFVARIVACDADGQPLPEEAPADVISGVVYAIDPETVLCEIEWIDEPSPGQIAALLEAAADAIEATDAR